MYYSNDDDDQKLQRKRKTKAVGKKSGAQSEVEMLQIAV